ncbi:MAG: hypothetical protein FJ060_13070 [Cyanobacteria bacterium K_Offshore_0m_m2_072]|nr:hypothetical protein [Cyanobacteria bacterium K_Offshore_0m_m2_072]
MTFNNALALVEELPERITINGADYLCADADQASQQALARLMFLQAELTRMGALMEELDANRNGVLAQLQERLPSA